MKSAIFSTRYSLARRALTMLPAAEAMAIECALDSTSDAALEGIYERFIYCGVNAKALCTKPERVYIIYGEEIDGVEAPVAAALADLGVAAAPCETLRVPGMPLTVMPVARGAIRRGESSAEGGLPIAVGVGRGDTEKAAYAAALAALCRPLDMPDESEREIASRLRALGRAPTPAVLSFGEGAERCVLGANWPLMCASALNPRG